MAPVLWLACALGTVAMALGGMVLLYQALLRLFPRWVAFTAALASLLCTPVLAYASACPYMAHVPSFALVSLLLWLTLTQDPAQSRTRLLEGMVCGWLAATRPQLAVMVLLPLVVHRPRSLVQGAVFAGGFLALAFPQALMWRMTFGRWLVNPQAVVSGVDWFIPPQDHALGVLFSPLHGLFLWHPLLLVGLAGLVLALWQPKLRVLAGVVLALFALQVYANSVPCSWSGGWAFGGRRFCEVVPLLMLGLAYLLARWRWWVVPTALAAWWNIGMLWAWTTPINQPPWAVLHPAEPLTVAAARSILAYLLPL
jgi:hypothetical protein